jgi:hypothetical protein
MTIEARPQWTEQMYRAVGGQDHLGLGSVVTDKILPALSPGINVLTPHPRYWSFYAFVVDEFWRRDLPRTNASLRRFLRSKESIFSIAGHLCSSPDHNVSPIGSRRVAPLVRTSPTTYAADFDYMKSSGGGYGLYYATVMQATGVVRLADRSLGLPVDTVTPVIGVEVAAAFRDAISGTKYWRRYFDKEDIPADVVHEYADVACLCRLSDGAPDREPLVDVFLHGGHPQEALARRTSLQMLMELSHQTRVAAVNQDDFRRLMLYRSAYDLETDLEVATFDPPSHLESVARRWRLSQLREMFNWSLNGMWQWICDWGLDREGDTFPVPIGDLNQVIESCPLRQLPGVTTKPSEPIGHLIEECRALASVTDSLDGRWELSTELSEDHLLTLLRSGQLDSEVHLAGLFVMYVMCLRRLWDPNLRAAVGAEDWRPVLEGGVRRIGMQFALDQLRSDARDGRTVAEVMERILGHQVIAQHERVALAKLPDDTFRFRREGGKLRFFQQPNGFQRNDSRFEALSTVCAELGWTGHLSQKGRRLSSEGQSIRKNGDLIAGDD